MLDKNKLKESIVYTDWGFEYLGYGNPFSSQNIFYVIDSKKLNNPIINDIVKEFNLRDKFIYHIDLNDKKTKQPYAYFYENTHTYYLSEKRLDLHKSNSKKIQSLLKEMYNYLFDFYVEINDKIHSHIFIQSKFQAYRLPTKVNDGSIEEISYSFMYCYNVKKSKFEDYFIFSPSGIDRNSYAFYSSENEWAQNYCNPYNNFLDNNSDSYSFDVLTLLLKDKIPFFDNYNELEKYVCSLSDSVQPYKLESLKEEYNRFKVTPKSPSVIETLQDILIYTEGSYPKIRSYFPHKINPISSSFSKSDIKTYTLNGTETNLKNSEINALKYRGETVFTSKKGFSIPGEIPVDYFNPSLKLEQYRTPEDKYELEKGEERARNFNASVTVYGSKPKNNKPKDEEPKGLCDFIDNLFFRKSRENK